MILYLSTIKTRCIKTIKKYERVIKQTINKTVKPFDENKKLKITIYYKNQKTGNLEIK